MGLIDRLKSNDISELSESPSDKETEAAHEILEIVGRKVQIVSPSRVIFASLAILLMFSAMFVIGNLMGRSTANFLLGLIISAIPIVV